MFTFGSVMAATFGSGGPGYSVVQLLVLASFGSLSSYIASALGQGQISNMIKLLTVFGCISIVIIQVINALRTIANAFGVSL